MTALNSPGRFFGWKVVWAAFVLATFGWGLGFYGPPVFLQAVHEARGWPLSLVSAAITTHYLVGAFIVANLPALYRRFGVAAVTKAGSAALALGLFGWSVAASPWQLFAATVLSGAGWVSMGAAAVNAIVAPWFVRGRPAALGMAYNGASMGGVVFSPLWVAAIATLGFSAAVAAVGLVAVATMWVLSDRVFRHTPESLGLSPDGDAADAPVPSAPASAAPPLPGRALWREPRFVTLVAGNVLWLVAQIGLISHLFSLMVPALGAQSAGLVMALVTIMAIAGRTLVGWLMPPSADRRLVACLSLAVQVMGSLAFIAAAGRQPALLILGAVLFGWGVGLCVSLPPLIAQAEFAHRDVPRVVALMVAVGQAFYAFAPAAFGLVRDLWPPEPGASPGSAPMFFLVAALIQAAAIAAYLVGRRRLQ